MRETVDLFFCDRCKKEVNRLHKANTFVWFIPPWFILDSTLELCDKCYQSYKRWKNEYSTD